MTTSQQRRPFMLTAVAALILALIGSASTLSMTAAQDSQIPEGAPVGIHSGTCGDLVTEPAYDGGEIGLTTVGEVQDDEFWNAGISEDPDAGALGVDLNDDDALSEDEIVGPIDDTEIQIGYAEADFDTGVDESEPYAVAVHASPEQYQTILACGSIADAVEGDDGMRYIPLQPTENSQLFGYSVLGDDNSSLRTFLFQPGQMPQQSAETPAAIAGYPIEVHEGTCQDWVFEPAYTIGDMLETNVAAEGEQEAGDTEGEVPAGAESLGSVYKVDTETDFDGNELLENETSYVVAVHMDADENYETLMACGQVLDIFDDDEVYVLLQPVGTSDLTGFAKINRDAGEVLGFLWSCQPIQPAPPEPTPTPAPTQTPSPTPTEAAVIQSTAVVTEVITETEVVPAPTATALAGGTPTEGTPTPAETPVEVTEVEIGGEEAFAIMVSPGQTLTFVNSSENERTVSMPDLQIEQTLGAGEQVEVQIPDDAETGEYSYQVLEGEETVLEGTLTVE